MQGSSLTGSSPPGTTIDEIVAPGPRGKGGIRIRVPEPTRLMRVLRLTRGDDPASRGFHRGIHPLHFEPGIRMSMDVCFAAGMRGLMGPVA